MVFAETAPRLPNTVCFAIPGVEAATLMIALDLAGVAVSSGSACSSGKVAPSHVLAAMGVARRTGARRHPPQSRLGVDGNGCRALRRGVRKRHGADARGAPGRRGAKSEAAPAQD